MYAWLNNAATSAAHEAQAMATDHKTKKAAVTAALKEYVQHHRQLRIFDLVGKVEYDEDYDYKKLRHRKPS